MMQAPAATGKKSTRPRAVKQPPGIKNDGNGRCMWCRAVMPSGRRRKYCSQECILKKAAAPARPLYRNNSVVVMKGIRKLNKMKVDAARKAMLKARARARDAERNLKAAQRAFDNAKRIADRNISRAKADAKKAKMATATKITTPKRTANASHVVMSRQTSVMASKPKGNGERPKRAAGASTATIGATAGVKQPKHKGKNDNGKPCEVCGKTITGRKSRKYCSDKCLYEKNNELGRLRNRNNPEKVREYRQKWYKNNPQGIGQAKKPAKSSRPAKSAGLDKAATGGVTAKPPKAAVKKTRRRLPKAAGTASMAAGQKPPKAATGVKITTDMPPNAVLSGSSPSVKHVMSRYLITLTYLYYAQYLVVDAAKPADAVDIARALVPHDWSARDTSMLRVYEAPLTAVLTSKWLQMTSTLDMHIEQRTSMCSRKVGL